MKENDKIREQQLVSLINLGLDATQRKRVDNHIHVSNLLDFCPREFAIIQEFGLPYNTEKKLSMRNKVTFRIGDKIHDMLSEALHGANILEAREIPFEIPLAKDITITGSCDNIIRFPDDKKCYVIECKSMDGEKFDQLQESPMINHELQLSLYLWFFQQTKWKSKLYSKKGLVVYVSKKDTDRPIRPFMINRATGFCEMVERQLKEVSTYLKTKKLPERICPTPLNPRARRVCQVTKYCFEEEK